MLRSICSSLFSFSFLVRSLSIFIGLTVDLSLYNRSGFSSFFTGFLGNVGILIISSNTQDKKEI